MAPSAKHAPAPLDRSRLSSHHARSPSSSSPTGPSPTPSDPFFGSRRPSLYQLRRGSLMNAAGLLVVDERTPKVMYGAWMGGVALVAMGALWGAGWKNGLRLAACERGHSAEEFLPLGPVVDQLACATTGFLQAALKAPQTTSLTWMMGGTYTCIITISYMLLSFVDTASILHSLALVCTLLLGNFFGLSATLPLFFAYYFLAPPKPFAPPPATCLANIRTRTLPALALSLAATSIVFLLPAEAVPVTLAVNGHTWTFTEGMYRQMLSYFPVWPLLHASSLLFIPGSMEVNVLSTLKIACGISAVLHWGGILRHLLSDAPLLSLFHLLPIASTNEPSSAIHTFLSFDYLLLNLSSFLFTAFAPLPGLALNPSTYPVRREFALAAALSLIAGPGVGMTWIFGRRLMKSRVVKSLGPIGPQRRDSVFYASPSVVAGEQGERRDSLFGGPEPQPGRRESVQFSAAGFGMSGERKMSLFDGFSFGGGGGGRKESLFPARAAGGGDKENKVAAFATGVQDRRSTIIRRDSQVEGFKTYSFK